MNPLVHLEVGSFFANSRSYSLRERKLIMLAALFPDLDGTLMPLDYMHKVFPSLQSIQIFSGDFGEKLHHTFSHNVFSCALFALALALYNRSKRTELFIMCWLAAVAQISLDLLTNDSSWPQRFLRPVYDHQFSIDPIIGWLGLGDPYIVKVFYIQYLLIVIFQATVVWIYLKKDRTFLELISPRLDRLMTDFVRLPISRKCHVCGARAFYRETEGERPLCPRHADIHRDLLIETKQPSEEDAA